MFTGIIKNLGKLKKKNDSLFVIEADEEFCKRIEKGMSISVDGVCLTVIQRPENTSFSVEIMPETGDKTMLNTLQTNSIVNLELPTTAADFLSGHIVQGHIDSTGKILKIEKNGSSHIFTISLRPNLINQVVKKGSIAINGISLTIINVAPDRFSVGIIPFTWENTMLKTSKIGDLVNIETDIIGKYVEKSLNKNL